MVAGFGRNMVAEASLELVTKLVGNWKKSIVDAVVVARQIVVAAVCSCLASSGGE